MVKPVRKPTIPRKQKKLVQDVTRETESNALQPTSTSRVKQHGEMSETVSHQETVRVGSQQKEPECARLRL